MKTILQYLNSLLLQHTRIKLHEDRTNAKDKTVDFCLKNFTKFFSFLAVTLVFIFLSFSFNVNAQNKVGEVIPKKDYSPLNIFEKFNPADEIIAKRDKTTKHYRNADGTVTAIVSAGKSLNYLNNGKWKTINEEINTNNTDINADYKFLNNENRFKTYYAQKNNKGLKIKFNEGVVHEWINPGMCWIGQHGIIDAEEAKIVNGEVNANTIKYPSVFPSIDVVFTQGSDGKKMDIIINDYSAFENPPQGAIAIGFYETIRIPENWSVEIYNDNGEESLSADNIGKVSKVGLIDSNGKVIVDYLTPFFYDYNVDNSKRTDNFQYGFYQTEQNDNELILYTIVPLTWLQNSYRVFPVTIDPTTSYYPDNTTYWTGYVKLETAVYTKYDGGTGTNYIRSIWTSSTEKRLGYAKFNISGITDGSTITDVDLIFRARAETAGSSWISFVRVSNEPVAAANATLYNDLNSKSGADNYTWTGALYASVSPDITYTGDLGTTADGDLQANLASDWFAVGFYPYDESTSYYLYAAPHNDATYKPYLSVTYTPPANSPPNAPTLYNTGGASQLCFNNAYINDDTPTYRVSTTDGDSDPVDYRIEIDNDPAFGSITWTRDFTNGGSHYTSGTTYNLDCSALTGITNGTTYYVRVKAIDPTGSNTYGSYSSGTFSFTYKSSGAVEWHQTDEAQFDADVLSNCNTPGDYVGGMSTTPISTEQIINTNDDGWNRPGNQSVTSVNLNLGYSGSEDYTSGIRFQTVPVPQGANIISASFQFRSYNTISDATSLLIYGNDIDNSTAFNTTTEKPALKTKTTNSASWSPSSWSVDSWYTSSDVSSPIQEIVDRAGWASNNSMSLIISNNGSTGYLQPYDYTGAAASAAKLNITYVTEATALSTMIDYASFDGATGWNQISFNDDETGSDIKYKVYYDVSGTPTIIPDGALAGNSTGFDSSPIVISGLNTVTYDKLYIKAFLTYTSSSPKIYDWTVSVGYGDSESDIVSDGGEYTNIPYDSYQTASGLTTGNSIKVAEFTIRDGGADFTDSDAKTTSLTDITFSIANFENIRALAIFSGATNKKEVTSVTASTIFSGISGLTCADGDANGENFTLYATFKSTVTDNNNLKFTVTSATASGSGSVFAAADAGGAATDDSGDNNKIVVTATKLAFTTQPSSSVCVNTALPQQPALTARDALDNTDVDYSGSITLSNTGTLTMSQSPPTPSSGIATFSGFLFTSGGETVTLSASDGSLTSEANSNNIDVKVSPTVTTTSISSIATTTVSSGGNVTSDGLGTVSARGVCWNTGGSPTTADSKTTDGSGTGIFASSITGLSACTQYYVRAYATNECGTSYGSEESFYSACGSSDIITAGNETANIDYASKTGASIGSTSDAIRVWSFTIRDGGGASDNDALGTELTDVTIDKGGSNGVTSWANTIKQAALYDGTTEIAEVSVTGESITFSGMSGSNVTAADNGNKTLDLYFTFETTNITDNQQFQFQITNANATAATSGSSDFSSFSAAVSSVSGNDNRIEVTATKLVFVTNEPPAQVQLGINFNVTVNAVDANDILDADQNSSITIALNSGTGTVSSATGLIQSLSLGTYAWTDVQYDTEEIFKIKAQHATLTDAVSININCTDAIDIDFESDNGSFTGDGEWEWGTPGAPIINTAHGGSKCWGTDLDEMYELNQTISLYSPVYKTTATTVYWKYWEAMEIENEATCSWDYVIPQYRINAGSWVDADSKVCSMVLTSWNQKSWTLSSGISIGDDIQFRWYLKSDNIQNEEGWYIDDVQFKNVTTVPSSVTLYNTSATSGEQIMFNGARYNTTTPVFAASATNSDNFNTFQVELNIKHDFSGTFYTQNITGSYSSGVKYNIECDNLSPILPSTDNAVYFVRVRAAADGGTYWSQWSHNASSQWIFIKGIENQGMCFTTQWQFDQGSAVSSNYGNYISSSDNATTSNYQDDYMQIDEASFDMRSTDDGVYECTTWWNGVTYMTIGYQDDNCTGSIRTGTRYVNVPIPKDADILSASYTLDDNNGCPCFDNAVVDLDVSAYDVDNAPAVTSSIASYTPTTNYVDWAITFTSGDDGTFTKSGMDAIVEEVISRAGWSAGNALTILTDDDPAEGSNGCVSQQEAGASVAARLQGTFTNFENEYKLPTIELASYESDGGTVEWGELIFEDDLSGCGACNIQYQVHNASNDAILVVYTRGTSSVIDISGVGTTASVYVKVKIKRNDSPKLTKIIVTTSNSVILPVELIEFSAHCEGNDVQIDWTTASEINNDYFTVERSIDGIDFKDIARINGAGNSIHTINYYYVDVNHVNGTSYYRLKQTDYDGISSYYDIVAVNCESRMSDFSIKPNPAKDVLIVTFNQTYESDAIIKIYDLRSKLVYSRRFKTTKGTNNINLNVEKFSKGTYFIHLINSDVYQALFIKK